ncbi:pyridoxal-phosphate dependent enzyme [Natronoglycomyces albus]|uniref:Pyridoxal-phosphate dependent enzyme n=1 Tax=Natronoglycomyces albus TaxID=2811108 RepID=A0A895XQT6_9ACTN|nr:pyridoxal-phosphate dependent enzyme [Natronoglycomyces albus]QSB06082.1 pyridoxal-phosphate dependent enzyme [Natronoglycomyces albus]
MIESPDSSGGFLHKRIAYINDALQADPQLIRLNQYRNPANVHAHRDTTAMHLHRQLGPIDLLVVGAGTTGTLMGCLEYRRQHRLDHEIAAVDAIGSVTFGGALRRRFIPGLGTSRRPEIYSEAEKFEQILISETETVVECRRLARRYGILVGGSTGTVLEAVRILGA